MNRQPTSQIPPEPVPRQRPLLVAGAIWTLHIPWRVAFILSPFVLFVVAPVIVGQSHPGWVALAIVCSAALFLISCYDGASLETLRRYAAAHGLQYLPGRAPGWFVMPGGPRRLGGFPRLFTRGMVGPIAGGAPGLLIVRYPNQSAGRYVVSSSASPAACYDFSASGGNVASWSFAVRFIGGRPQIDPPNNQAAGSLLSPDFLGWMRQFGGASFDVSGGWLFVIDPAYKGHLGPSDIDRLAEAGAQITKRVIEASSEQPRPIVPAAGRYTENPRRTYGFIGALLAACVIFTILIVHAQLVDTSPGGSSGQPAIAFPSLPPFSFPAFSLPPVAIPSSGPFGTLTDGSTQPLTSSAVAGIGVPVTAGGERVVLEKAEEWSGNGIFPPTAGDVYVTVHLAITPTVADAYVDIFGTKVEGDDGTSYEPVLLGERDPILPTGILTQGATALGWMTFQVPSGLVGNLTLLYSAGSGNTAPIKLY